MKPKFPKLLLFILSMAPFFIILGLMTMNIPISFDSEAHFIGWKAVWQNTRFGCVIIVISVIFELIIYLLFNRVCKRGSCEQTECIETIANKNFELVSFVTSIFLPLISFQYDQLNHWVVTLFVILMIGYIYCKSDGYFTNPTLAIFGYRLYDVKLNNMNEGNRHSRCLIILSKSDLNEGDTIRCYKLTDRVSYAKKIIVKNHNDD